MTPAVIADSDGNESDDAASSPEKGVPPAVALQNSSPTTTTHPSGSTDPTFFKNIYNEHRDAANQYVMNQPEESSEVMEASSFDKGFQETRGTGIHDKSLWDVPSSPEFAQLKPSKKHHDSLNTRTKITRGLRRRLDDIGYISQEDELPEMAAQSKKKRRVEQETGPDDLVSTAPIESDPSFMVAPTALTSQKEMHLSVHSGALDSVTKSLEQRCINVMSSDTATNINTPRSNDVALLEASPEIKGSKPARAVVACDSSPVDPVHLPVSETEHGTAKEKGRKESKKKVVVASDDENEQGHEHAPWEATQGDDMDFEEMPRPTEKKKKKQRGRPRKTDTAVPNASERRKDPETNVKRKRGRPKKSAAVLNPDNDNKVQDIAPAILKPVHAESSIEQQPDVKTKLAKNLGPGVSETESHVAAKPETKETPETPTSDTKAGASISTVKKTEGRTRSTSAGGSGRPLYRVGLSKNTRIAPLLKVIRK